MPDPPVSPPWQNYPPLGLPPHLRSQFLTRLPPGDKGFAFVYQTPFLVGASGAPTQGGFGLSCSPAYGQTPSVGTLLVLDVAVANVATLPTTPAGWTVAVTAVGTSVSSTIYYRIATGGDAAPTIAAITNGVISAQLSEYAGINTASPLFTTSTVAGTTSPQVATNNQADIAAGTLVITSGSHLRTAGTLGSQTDTLNNGASAVATNNKSTATQYHFDFTYGVTTGHASAQSDSMAFTTTGITGMCLALATFTPLVDPAIATFTDPFTSPLTLASIWADSTTGALAPVIGGGQVVLTYDLGYPVAQTSLTYDLTNSAIYCMVPASTSTLQQTSFSLIDGTHNIIFTIYENTITYQYKALAGNIFGPSPAYDPVNHLWLKIANSVGQTIVLSTSPDGISWSQFGTFQYAANINHFEVQFQVGTVSGTPVGTCAFSNLNIPAAPVDAGAVTMAGSASWTDSSGTLVTEVATVTEAATAGLTVGGTVTPGAGVSGAVSMAASAAWTDSAGSMVTEVASVVQLAGSTGVYVGSVVELAALTEAATAGMAIGALVTEVASVSLAASAGMTVAATVTEIAAVTEAAAAGLTVGAAVTEVAAVTEAASASLTVGAAVTEVAQVSLAGSAGLSVAASVTEIASVSMAATTGLTATSGNQKISTLLDPFTSSSTLSTLWGNSSTGLGAPVIGGGTMSIPYATAYYSAGSTSFYDLTASAVYAKVALTSATDYQSSMICQIDANNQIVFTVYNGLLTWQYSIAGTNTFGGSLTYDPVNHAYLKIANTSGTSFALSTSADGSSWVQRFTFTYTPAVTAVELRFQAGYFTGTTPSGSLVISSLNFTTYLGTAVLSATAGLTVTALVTEIAAVTEAATAGLTVPSVVTEAGVVTEAASAGMTVAASVTEIVTVAEGATSGLTVSSLVTEIASVSESATAALTVPAVVTEPASVAESATAGLTVSATSGGSVSVNEAASAAMTVAGLLQQFATVNLVGTASLSVPARVTEPAAVTLSASAGMTIAGIATRFATVAMSATAGLTVTIVLLVVPVVVEVQPRVFVAVVPSRTFEADVSVRNFTAAVQPRSFAASVAPRIFDVEVST